MNDKKNLHERLLIIATAIAIIAMYLKTIFWA